MSRTPKSISGEDAREIAEFLLDKGISQTQIASTVKRSQSWVAGVKRERDIARYAKEAGRQEVKNEIVEKATNQLARAISNNFLSSSSAPMLPSNDD